MGRKKKQVNSYVAGHNPANILAAEGLREEYSRLQWQIADLALRMHQEFSAKNVDAVKAIGIVLGMKAKNVRNAIRVAGYFGNILRTEYSHLPYEYFVRAWRLRPEQPRSLLDWCNFVRDTEGYIPSLDDVDVQFSRHSYSGPALQDEPPSMPVDVHRRKMKYAAKELARELKKNQVGLDVPPQVLENQVAVLQAVALQIDDAQRYNPLNEIITMEDVYDSEAK